MSLIALDFLCMNKTDVQEEVETYHFRPIDLRDWLEESSEQVYYSVEIGWKKAYVFIRSIVLLLNNKTKCLESARNNVHGVKPFDAIGLLCYVVQKTDDGKADTKIVSFLADEDVQWLGNSAKHW